MWTTDDDWRSGILDSNLVIQGTGAAASLQLRRSDFPDWMKMNPSTVPPARDSYCLAWIEIDNSFLMFGGSGAGGDLGDTWKYHFATDAWTQLTPATHPSSRTKPGCAYDPVHKVVVLFGGNAAGTWSSETWLFNATTSAWVQASPSGSIPRDHETTPMAFDVQQKKMIMVTRNGVMTRMDTWTYDVGADAWTLRTTGGPGLRDGHNIGFMPLSNKTFLFSGGEGTNLYCDYWQYDYVPNTWTKIRDCIPNEDPNARVGHGMMWRESYQGIVMFGGRDQTGYPPESWVWLDPVSKWSLPTISGTPFGRAFIQLGHSPVDDATILFGGSNAGGLKNDTWALAKGYVSGVDGVWTSSVTPADSGCSNPTYGRIYWNRTSNPPTTNLRFQIATATSTTGPWTFTGPGGLPGTHYTVWGSQIDSGNNGREYFRVLAKLKTGNGLVTPTLEDLALTWKCPVQPPAIIQTSPGAGSTGWPVAAPIWVNFSESMNVSSVTWTISGGVSAAFSWSSGDKTLKLTPMAPLRDCTGYAVEITGGKDKNDDLALVPGPVPNPFSFETVCIHPFIVSTDPPDGGVRVPLGKTIVVQFSEPMNVSTVTRTILPAVPLGSSWNAARDILYLTPTSLQSCTDYTVSITSGLDDQGLPLVPGPVPNPWRFFTDCPNPYVEATSPAAGSIDVPLDAKIVVTFSEPMDRPTVAWTFSDPGIVFDPPGWSSGDTVLTLNHSAPFAQARTYTVTITGGRDLSGNALVPGPVPNPWSFTTVDLLPFITCESPPDGAVNVPLTADIIVCFSEPMNTTLISFSITPSITVIATWNSAHDIMTLSHPVPFSYCTRYTVFIGGVGPGPLPNPWSFQTFCPGGAAGGLQVLELPPDSVLLTWRSVPGATAYRVYSSSSPVAPFPSAWTVRGTTTATQFTAVGDLADLNAYFYLVRATNGSVEWPNSTMGTKATLRFEYSPSNTNIAWFSLPYVSSYRQASDIANRLGPANIDVVGKWDIATQKSELYYYARGQWRGTNFAIEPGDALFLGTRRAFSWAVTGTDLSISRTFLMRPVPASNQDWIGVPYTGVYQTASDIATELTPAKIIEVGLWNSTTQSSIRWRWNGSVWTGVNFRIPPGAGIYIILASSFTWTPRLATPVVP